jgi:hypothetical protein
MAAMPDPLLNIPPGVIDWVRDVFIAVNTRSASTLSRIPNIFETTLDQNLVSHLSEYSAPFKFPSDWIVTIDTHFLGGGRYWGRWEIADIGIIVVFRRKGVVLGTKLALMQSKRLYPDEIETAIDIHRIDYQIGFGRLLSSDSEYRSQVRPRTFNFTQTSKYRALEYHNDQYDEILKYTSSYGIPVYYLLYNPLAIPSSAVLPVSGAMQTSQSNLLVGCRVMKSDLVDTKLGAARLNKSANPSFAQIGGVPMDADFWTLHNFVADLVLGCKEGHRSGTDPMSDENLFRVFNLRSGPISAAISITIDAPEGG